MALMNPNIQNKSVLHIGNPAGVASVLSNEQRRLGINSNVIVFDSKYRFGADETININPDLRRSPSKIYHLCRIKNKMSEIQQRIDSVDIIHFHYKSAISLSYPLIPRGIDLPVWKAQNKKVIMHLHGSDIRWKDFPRLYRVFSDKIIVSTPDLLEWVPDTAQWIPRPIDTASIEPSYVQLDDPSPIKIIHAPTDREIKGTNHVVQAVSELNSNGIDIDLHIIENTPHEEAIELYKTADIIVDWINPDYGLYGMFGIESMALGKPVCATLGESVKEQLPSDNPIINTTPKDLSNKLRLLINERDLKRIGKKGRAYTESFHNVRKVVDMYNSIYLALLS